MRKDMDRILVGRPRLGGNTPKGTGRGKDSRNLEDLPTKESMKDRWKKGNLKSLNENLAPFYRYLCKQVGRPWNKVYSEIRERINARSAVQLHILQHLEQYVEKHVEYDGEGTPRKKGGFFSWSSSEVDGLYVCPNTGLLKEHRRPTRPQGNKKTKYILLDGKKYIRTEHGWFEIDLARADRRWERNPKWGKEKGQPYSILVQDKCWDALRKEWLGVEELYDLYGDYVRCSAKRPLNKKEIKQLGLRNK